MQPQLPPQSGLANVIRSSALGLAAVGVFSFFLNMLLLVSPIYMQQVFDRVLTTHHINTLLYLTLFAVICLVFLALFDGVRSYCLTRIGRWWDETLREEILHAALFQSRVIGKNATNALADLQTVRSFIGGNNITPFFDAPWMPLFLLVIFLLHWVLGVIGLIGALVLGVLAITNDILTKRAILSAGERSIRLNNFTTTALRHADSVHAMGMFQNVARHYDRMAAEIANVTQLGADRSSIIGAASKGIRIGIQVIILAAGAYLVTRNELTGGAMIAASIILGRALGPVEQGLSAWKSFVAARAAHKRLELLVSYVPPQEKATSLPAPRGHLTVENVSFRLPGMDRPILRNINFQIEPGAILGVIGPSGSGKSTLCRLLVGSWPPTVGHVRMDGADIGRWDRNEIGKHLGYLSQSVELFGGSVRENIARLGEAKDEEIIAAAKLAGCHELVQHLPNEYETNIGEGGAFLSGGQRQRIGLARAVFRKPRLLVLDEPNSNLDVEGKQRLLTALVEMKRAGAAIVLVTHETMLLSAADHIMILRDGVVEKIGRRNEFEKAVADMQKKQAAAAVESRRPKTDAPAE